MPLRYHLFTLSHFYVIKKNKWCLIIDNTAHIHMFCTQLIDVNKRNHRNQEFFQIYLIWFNITNHDVVWQLTTLTQNKVTEHVFSEINLVMTSLKLSLSHSQLSYQQVYEWSFMTPLLVCGSTSQFFHERLAHTVRWLQAVRLPDRIFSQFAQFKVWQNP